MVMVLAMSISTFADETNTDVKNAAAKGTGNFSITMTGAEDGHKERQAQRYRLG